MPRVYWEFGRWLGTNPSGLSLTDLAVSSSSFRSPMTKLSILEDLIPRRISNGFPILSTSGPLLSLLYCPRDLYLRHDATVQYPLVRRCVILFCYCLALRSPRNSDGSRVTAIDFEIKRFLHDYIRRRRGDG